MIKENEEMLKLLNFILEHQKILNEDSNLFDSETLKIIKKIIKGKIEYYDFLTDDQEKALVKAFLSTNSIFNDETPYIIASNEECIKSSLDKDVVSTLENIPYTSYLSIESSKELKQYVINKALEQDVILNKDSHSILTQSYDVAANSIKNDPASADFVDWIAIEDANMDDRLIDLAIEHNYCLSNNSCYPLKSNRKIVLDAIKKDVNNFNFSNISIQSDQEIFEYLLFHDYKIPRVLLHNLKLEKLTKFEVLERVLKELKLNITGDDKFNRNVTNLFYSMITEFPTIKTFEPIFQLAAEEEWKEHKRKSPEYYENIFGKICAVLRNDKDFPTCLYKLPMFQLIKEELGKKYVILYRAMEEYHKIYHSDSKSKLEQLQSSKDTISELSALYISKSKEKYKNRIMTSCYNWLKDFFVLDLDNKEVKKKIIGNLQKEKFYDSYNLEYKDTIDFINTIKEKYKGYISEDKIDIIIEKFLRKNCSKIEYIILPPDKYFDYKRYQKAKKLINRLNSGYIGYYSPEMSNYKDIIELDDNSNKYTYTGPKFQGEDIYACNEYEVVTKVFESIKKDIMHKISTIDIGEYKDSISLSDYDDDFPFTDRYYTFDKNKNLKFVLNDLRDILFDGYNTRRLCFTSDESVEAIHNFVIKNGMGWFTLFCGSQNRVLSDNGLFDFSIGEVLHEMDDIVELAKGFNTDPNNLKNVLLLKKISSYATEETLAILGSTLVDKLCKDMGYTGENEKTILKMAKDLVSEMVKREKSTVPYVSGEIGDYRYSVYDSQDETLLLAGINTDACFRIDGNDNDFLHYCALDKNGIVIKITDNFGNFIGRASGFRNGNCVFFNQLRTVYDEGGVGCNNNNNFEGKDIIKTFKKACQDIVSTSQNNTKEEDKIDFVFVTKNYLLKETPSNVSSEVESEIGFMPMDTDSEDWQKFKNETNNLTADVYTHNYFETDYSGYELICMASSKNIWDIEATDIKPKDVSALYERKRNSITITNKHDSETIRKVNKIKGIHSYHYNSDFSTANIPKGAYVFMGDNWYIVYDNQVIDSCYLEFDKNAKKEYEATVEILKECNVQKETDSDGMDIKKISGRLQSKSPKMQIKQLVY